MHLSMWILADWLAAYHPITNIKNGQLSIKGVRMFSMDSAKERENIYVGRAADFFNTLSKGVICAQGDDILIIEDEDPDQVFNDILRAFDHYNSWEYSMNEAADNQVPLQALLEKSRLVFADPLLIYDSAFYICACVDLTEDSFSSSLIEKEHIQPGFLFTSRTDIYRSRKAGYSMISKLPQDNQHFILSSICHKGNYLGSVLLLEEKRKVSLGRRQLCQIFTSILDRWFKKNPNRDILLPEPAIFRQLLDKDAPSGSSVMKYLELLTWKEEDQKLLLISAHNNRPCTIEDNLYVRIEQNFFSCYAFLYKDNIIIIANISIAKTEKLFSLLSKWTKEKFMRTGVSYPFSDIMKLYESYRQADIALHFGSLKAGAINTYEHTALNYAHHILMDHLDTDIEHPALTLLREHDTKHKTELYNTLYEFLRHERNLVLTAEKLNIHRNSLVYRIKKIEQIVPLTLNDPDLRAYLMLCFELQHKRKG